MLFNFDLFFSNKNLNVWNQETHLGNAAIINDRGKKISMLEKKTNALIHEILKVHKSGSLLNIKPTIYIIPQA